MIREYKYRLHPPDVNAELVSTQMWLAHRYRNVLVEIERERRAQCSAALSAHPEVQGLELRVQQLTSELAAAREDIKKTRAKARKRAETPEQRARAKEILAELRAVRLQAKEARKAALEDFAVTEALGVAQERSSARIKEEREKCGVYWGTYLLQEQAAEQARRAPAPPEFVKWTGEGRVSAQLQGGLDLEDLWGKNTLVHILRSAPNTTGRRQGRNSRLRLRVQSERGKPVWAEWTLIYHRELPAGARIKVATVIRRRHGPVFTWHLLLSVDEAACVRRSIGPQDTTTAVALNLGFARRDETIRAGYLVGSDGWEHEVLVAKSDVYRRGRNPDDPPSIEERRWIEQGLERADKLRSERDLEMNKLRDEILAWIASKAPEQLPEWFRERVSHMAAWRSPNRFTQLAREWELARWEDGDAAFAKIDLWRQRDFQLARCEAGTRSSALRDRLEGYRLLASIVARRYHTLVVDDTDLRAFQANSEPEDPDPDISTWKRQQRIAAPRELRGALINAFGPDRVIKRSAKDVTRRHATCGALNERVIGAREVTCSGCGVVHDQDANACKNLLRDLSSESRGPAESKAGRGERLRAAASARRQARASEPAAEV